MIFTAAMYLGVCVRVPQPQYIAAVKASVKIGKGKT